MKKRAAKKLVASNQSLQMISASAIEVVAGGDLPGSGFDALKGLGLIDPPAEP